MKLRKVELWSDEQHKIRISPIDVNYLKVNKEEIRINHYLIERKDLSYSQWVKNLDELNKFFEI